MFYARNDDCHAHNVFLYSVEEKEDSWNAHDVLRQTNSDVVVDHNRVIEIHGRVVA
jgi:hypothetical protein